MEVNSEIKDFMDRYINMNQSRINNAKEKVDAIKTFLSNNLEEYVDSTYQWSMWYDTVIKPNPDSENWEYDVDLAVKIRYNEEWNWNPKQYYNIVYDCLKKSDRYAWKVTDEKERAIRLVYDGNDWEFHMDLVPTFYVDWNWYVVDHKKNVSEISWWFGFKDWVNSQNNKTSVQWSSEKFLKKIIKIYKFFRNQWSISDIKSVQLTLLLARQIDNLEEQDFLSISSSLYHISKSLKDEIESCEHLENLDLSNPTLSEEKFDRNLDEDKYQNFRCSIINLTNDIISAYEEKDQATSLELWKNIFGDSFADNTTKTLRTQYDFSHAQKPSDIWLFTEWLPKKIKIKCKTKFYNQPWMWYSYNAYRKKIVEGSEIIFYTYGIPLNKNNHIIRQVTNNNKSKDLRWEIGKPSKDLWYLNVIWWYAIKEEACYKWIHWVKCYLINSERKIIAESDKFLVNIQ